MPRRNGEDVYVKGTTVQTIRTDKSGFSLESIERDTDGLLWHVVEGKAPVRVSDDDVRAVAAESSNTGDGQ